MEYRRTMGEHLENLAFRTLDSGGFFLAFVMGGILLYFGGIAYFLFLSAFFVAASYFTFFGAKWKGPHRLRAWQNVLANGAFPAFAAILRSRELFFGSVCALAGDKLSGEIGQTSRRHPRLITDLNKMVIPGTNGGITALGELSAAATGVFFGALGFILFRNHSLSAYLVAGFLCSFLGSNFDSLLGATLENRGFLDKHGVNFLASVFGALIAVIFLK